VILVVFYAGLTIETDVMVDFGLKDTGMGIFLVLVNIAILGAALGFGYLRFHRKRLKEAQAQESSRRIEPADNFTATKFETTFNALVQSYVPAKNILVFHYTSHSGAAMALRSGIPAQSQHQGVAFTLRQPHAVSQAEKVVFGAASKEDAATTASSLHHSSKFSFDVVLAVSLPVELLEPLPGFETDPCLCKISVDALSAMRPFAFASTAVVDLRAWSDGYVLLPPTCIVRTYALIAKSTDEEARLGRQARTGSTAAFGIRNSLPRIRTSSLSTTNLLPSDVPTTTWLQDRAAPPTAPLPKAEPIPISNMREYIVHMKRLRSQAQSLGLVPLFHFTSTTTAPHIIEGGLRMSTQGQGIKMPFVHVTFESTLINYFPPHTFHGQAMEVFTSQF
jgi:hypothetical protein